MDPLETETAQLLGEPRRAQRRRSGEDPDRGVPAADDVLRRGGRQPDQFRRAGCSGTGRRPTAGRGEQPTSRSWPASSAACRRCIAKDGGAFPDPILNLTWNYRRSGRSASRTSSRRRSTATRSGRDGPPIRRKVLLHAGQQLDGLRAAARRRQDGVRLLDLHAAAIPSTATSMARRDTADPREQGLAPNWAFSWPANRRILYNRASSDPAGKPWNPAKALIAWNGTRWAGIDVPDFAPTTQAGGRRRAVHHEPGRHRRGCSRATRCAKARSRSTTSRSKARSPNLLHPEGRAPIRWRACSRTTARRSATPTKFPYVGTTYRLTEHFHFWTKHAHDQRDPAAGGVRRDRRGAGEGERASARATGCACRSNRGSVKAQGLRHQAHQADAWSTASRCT